MQKKEENLQRKIKEEELEHQKSVAALVKEQVKEDLKRLPMERRKIENAKLDIQGVQLELQRDRRKEEHDDQEREEEEQMKRIEEELERQKKEEGLEEQKHQEELEKTKKEMEHMDQELERKETEWQRQSEIQEQELVTRKRQLELARQEREEKQKREEEYWRQKLEEEDRRKKEKEELHTQQLKEREEDERKELEKQKIERQLQRQKLQHQLEDQKREREKQRQKREEERESQRRERDMKIQKREKELMMQEKEKEIQAKFEELYIGFKQFDGNVPEKSMSLHDHVNSLKEVADAVDQDNRVANYAGVTGATLSVAGGIVTLSGAALAPFTGGASLVASVGVGGAFAGGFTRVLGSVKQNLDKKKNEKRVNEILNSCQQSLEAMHSNYTQLLTKMQELEMKNLKSEYIMVIQEMKLRLSMFEPALKAEMFKVVLRSITQLTARLLSRVMVEKVSQEVSHVAATEMAKQVAQKMAKSSTSYWSYEAIKELLTFSSREVSKKWYVDVARTSAVASGVAAAVFLPFDVKDLHQEATNLRKGAQSIMAEEIRHVADLLLEITCKLNNLYETDNLS